MIKPSYTEWVGIFCFMQVLQLALCIWFVKNQKPIDKEEIIGRLSDQNIKLNGLTIKTLRELLSVEVK